MIIGLMGPIGVGKTTVAKEIVNHYNGTYVRKSFSEPIKSVADAFGFKYANGTQDEKEVIDEDWGVSARTFMQCFGTEICRNNMKYLIPGMQVDDNVFVLIMKKKIMQLLSEGKNVIIDDVRFPNEYNMIKQLGGLIVLVDRLDFTEKNISNILHESELYHNIMVSDHKVSNYLDMINIINKITHI